ncbi:MAG: N-acetylmuramoyl-L-alanine amidase [Agathobacter sp.]|nr:N-acetylmuramoyl-L-alanine amidase [Agathobacter sp.]
MEKKVLQGITVAMGVITVCVCMALYFLPAIKEQWILAAELTDAAVGQDVIEIEESEEEKLYIEIPEGIDGKDIVIRNDYVSQTIYVRFEKGIDNYAENYSVYGSSNHIAGMSYYKENSEGVLAIHLDRLYEISYYYEDGNLCLSFIDPRDIYDKIIVVDAGHGGRMTGAVKRGVEEKVLNLDIVKEIKAIFDEVDEKEIKVYYTRLDDSNPSLSERVGMANKVDADLFISIHNNASSTGLFNDENGTMVLYNPLDESEKNSKRFARICLENVNKSTGSTELGLVNGENIYIVRYSQVPVALIEVGYMTNDKEWQDLQTPEYQRKVAEGVYQAVIEAFAEGF